MPLRTPSWIIGIDEAGRGPLAGPVAVGVVLVPYGFDWDLIPGVTDSKQLTPAVRAELLRAAQSLRYRSELNFTVAMIGASDIDVNGISWAVTQAIERALKRFQVPPEEVLVRLDGGLRAPEVFPQMTYIRGDALWPEIGLASIVAKETRDHFMRKISRRYPQYDFAAHKGYGTIAHRAAILRCGLSPIHRVTYCSNILRHRQERQ